MVHATTKSALISTKSHVSKMRNMTTKFMKKLCRSLVKINSVKIVMNNVLNAMNHNAKTVMNNVLSAVNNNVKTAQSAVNSNVRNRVKTSVHHVANTVSNSKTLMFKTNSKMQCHVVTAVTNLVQSAQIAIAIQVY